MIEKRAPFISVSGAPKPAPSLPNCIQFVVIVARRAFYPLLPTLFLSLFAFCCPCLWPLQLRNLF